VSRSAFFRMLLMCGAILTTELAIYFCFFEAQAAVSPRHDTSPQAESSHFDSRLAGRFLAAPRPLLGGTPLRRNEAPAQGEPGLSQSWRDGFKLLTIGPSGVGRVA
jgi:hypothetical protein